MSKPKFDGKTVRRYLTLEANALLARYRQFEALVPSFKDSGAAHKAEDGRFVEALFRDFLRGVLPSSLLVSSGFILRPAVKTGQHREDRRGGKDSHSGQLDIVVYDSARYPIFQSLGTNIIVPPEGVLAVISVKKHLRDGDIESEVGALQKAAELCRCLDREGKEAVRGPFLALVAASLKIKKQKQTAQEWIFERLKSTYSIPPYFDEAVGYVGALDTLSIFKTRPTDSCTNAEYVWFGHENDNQHLALQFILNGILSVFYDPYRTNLARPGYSAFAAEHSAARTLGTIQVAGLRFGKKSRRR